MKHVNRESLLTPALLNAPIYQKCVTVLAREARPGEIVDTVMADGHFETTNTASEGDWVITNPSGEVFVVQPQRFSSRGEMNERRGGSR